MNETSPYQLVFRGATVVDGTGAPRYRADVAVREGKIEAIGEVPQAQAQETVDARDLVLAPGFIDAHTHDDRAVLATPSMPAKVSQGVTTVVTGNCGISLAPLDGVEPTPPLNLIGSRSMFHPTFDSYFDTLARNPAAINVAAQVGHTALRRAAMDNLDVAATPAEIGEMQRQLEAAMRAGCIGMSTGLAYPPANAAPTEEVIALVERLGKYGGIHTTHMRNEKEGVLDSVRETLEIGRRAGVPVVISHHKCSGRENWGSTRETLALISQAQQEQSVDLDVYPYTASSTVLLPDFVASAERVLITWSEQAPEQAGRDLADIVAEWGCSVDDAIARLLPAGAIYFQMDEADLERIVRFSGAMIGSDGLPHDAVPHPRLWGTFPRVLGEFSRERGWLTLEDAVYRMTGKTAQVFGFPERGVIRAGAAADLVLFDAQTIIDAATYERPTECAKGIVGVYVAGQAVWRDGRETGARPGRALRRTSPGARA
jgi:N-acyl-D-amino-acid deacylase